MFNLIKNNLILKIILIIVFLLVIFLVYKLWNNYKNDNNVSEQYYFFSEGTNVLVRGYVVTRNISEFSEIYGEINQTNLYFKLIEADPSFISRLEGKINEMNQVNLLDKDGGILFNLGCLENGEIISDGRENYINQTTKDTILDSTINNPVWINLHFSPELGKGCLCCSFTDKVFIFE